MTLPNNDPVQIAVTPDHSQIYITSLFGLIVVNGISYTVTKTLPGGDTGAIVSNDGSRVYVASQNPSYLAYVVDTTSNTVNHYIANSGAGTTGAVALTPDGQTLLVAAANGLAEVSTATNKVIGIIPSFNLSFYLALATDGKYAYYSPRVESGFFQFDLAERTYQMVPIGGEAAAVRVAQPSGGVYLLQTLNTVVTSSVASAKVTGNVRVGGGNASLAISGSGNAAAAASVFTTTQGALLGTISRIDTSSTTKAV